MARILCYGKAQVQPRVKIQEKKVLYASHQVWPACRCKGAMDEKTPGKIPFGEVGELGICRGLKQGKSRDGNSVNHWAGYAELVSERIEEANA